jgi:UDP-N-acetylglucosamine 2-epimerase (non-hydrolysing)
VAPEKVLVTGNTVIDALYQTVSPGYRFHNPVIREAANSGYRIILVTTHRRENWGEPLAGVYRALKNAVVAHPDLAVVFPVHRNPVVYDMATAAFKGCPRAYLTEPLPYAEFANLMARSFFILTDSGGLQEEAPALGKPVLVLRDVTERPEAVEAGTVNIVGTEERRVSAALERMVNDAAYYQKMANAVNPYGDGKAAPRIRDGLLHHFGQGPRPEEFSPGKSSIEHKGFNVKTR